MPQIVFLALLQCLSPTTLRTQHSFRCWSSVGQQVSKPGPQLLSVGPGCDKKGIIMHELMHAVGFWHEQSRTDRNKYVEVLWENVGKGELAENKAPLYPVEICFAFFYCLSSCLIVSLASCMSICVMAGQSISTSVRPSSSLNDCLFRLFFRLQFLWFVCFACIVMSMEIAIIFWS